MGTTVQLHIAEYADTYQGSYEQVYGKVTVSDVDSVATAVTADASETSVTVDASATTVEVD